MGGGRPSPPMAGAGCGWRRWAAPWSAPGGLVGPHRLDGSDQCTSEPVLPATDRGDWLQPKQVGTGRNAAVHANGPLDHRNLWRVEQVGARYPGGAAPATRGRPSLSVTGLSPVDSA